MKKAVLVAAVLLCLGAFAQDEVDPVQGFYEGAFTAPWDKVAVRAELVCISDLNDQRRYKAVFFLTPEAEDVQRVEVQNILKDEPQEPLNLSGAIGGSYTVKATLEGGVFAGMFANETVQAPFSLNRIKKQPPTLGQSAPEGATVLLDGTNLDQWVRHPEKWCLQGDGSMEVCGSSLKTTQQFGDAQYHIEFRTPFMPNARGQARGNSGVYVQGRYEVQVLDSFGEPPAWDYCGGIYKIAVPLKNASLPPGEWQTYDITYYAPKFDEAGTKTQNAKITVVHNGETIHDNLELPNATPGGVDDKEQPTGVLMLQDHHDSVRYKNIWVAPLAAAAG